MYIFGLAFQGLFEKKVTPTKIFFLGGRADTPCVSYSGGLDDTASVVLCSIDSIFFDKKYKNFR